MDGKSLTAFLTPNLEADAAPKVAGWRKAFLNECDSDSGDTIVATSGSLLALVIEQTVGYGWGWL